MFNCILFFLLLSYFCAQTSLTRWNVYFFFTLWRKIVFLINFRTKFISYINLLFELASNILVFLFGSSYWLIYFSFYFFIFDWSFDSRRSESTAPFLILWRELFLLYLVWFNHNLFLIFLVCLYFTFFLLGLFIYLINICHQIDSSFYSKWLRWKWPILILTKLRMVHVVIILPAFLIDDVNLNLRIHIIFILFIFTFLSRKNSTASSNIVEWFMCGKRRIIRLALLSNFFHGIAIFIH